MCIIAYKPIGVEMPDKKTVNAMFDNNPDGAGLMFPYKGRVAIIKGLMKLEDVYDAIKEIDCKIDLKNTPVVMHFRIGTHGGLSKANTHPFPVTAHVPLLQKLRLKTDVAIVHNGIIHGTQYSKDLSDTMEYVKGQLALFQKIDSKFYLDDNFVKAIGYAIDSKMIIMDGQQNVVLIGEFYEETNGMIYSNYTYIARTARSYRSSGYRGYTSEKKLIKKHLMWLGDEDGYVKYQSGRTVEAGTFLMGADGKLYKTMSGTGNVYEIPYATAYNHQGLSLKFDETFASDVDVETWVYTYDNDDDDWEDYTSYYAKELKKLDAGTSTVSLKERKA